MSRRRAIRTLLCAVGACLLGVLFAPSAAFAEDDIVDSKSVPAENQVLTAPPDKIVMTVNRELDAPPNIKLEFGSEGVEIEISDPIQGATAAEWTFAPLTTLADGTYRVLVDGSAVLAYSFTIGQPAPTATFVAGGSVPDATSAPADSATAASAASLPNDRLIRTFHWIGRILAYLGLAALAGGLVLIAVAWQEGVEYTQTVRFLRACWLAGMAGSVIVLAAMSAKAYDTGFSAGLSPSRWMDLFSDSTPGKAAVVRLLCAVLAGWVALAPEKAVDAATQIPALTFPLLAMATYGFSRTDGTRMVALGIAAGIVHAIGFAVWFGGLAMLSRVTLIGPGESDQVDAVRGFNRLAVLGLLAVGASGLVQVVRLLGGPGEVLGSTWGRLWTVKFVIAAIMAKVATDNRHVVSGKLARRSRLTDRAAYRLGKAVGGEARLGVIAIVLSALMMGSTPSGVVEAERPSTSIPTLVDPPLLFVNEESGFDATIGFTSAAAGLNTAVVVVRKPLNTLRELNVQILPVDGYTDGYQIRLTDDDLRRSGTVKIPGMRFNSGGRWIVIIDGATQTGTIAEMKQIMELTGDVVPAPGAQATPATTVPPTTVAPG